MSVTGGGLFIPFMWPLHLNNLCISYMQTNMPMQTMTTTETELNIGKKKGQVLVVVLLVVLADLRRKCAGETQREERTQQQRLLSPEGFVTSPPDPACQYFIV